MDDSGIPQALPVLSEPSLPASEEKQMGPARRRREAQLQAVYTLLFPEELWGPLAAGLNHSWVCMSATTS